MRSTFQPSTPTVVGYVYPDGESTFGWYTPKVKPQPPIKPYKRTLPPWANGSEEEFQRAKEGTVRNIARENQDSTLGLSTLSISHKRPKKGSKGITSDQKRRVRNCAHLMAESAPSRTLAFLTLTIPTVNDSESASINLEWSNIVRTFLQWLKRRLEANGLPGDYVSVTEIQEERFKRTGQLPLHLHILFQGRKTPFTQWAVSYLDIRTHWLKLLSDVVGRKLESNAVENISLVKGKAGAYISKYMTKGSKVIQEVKEKGLEDQLPTAWVNISQSLKKRLKASIKVITDKAYLILRYKEVLAKQKMIAYSHNIYLPGTDNHPPKLIGVYIKFRDLVAFYESLDLIALWESEFNRNPTDVVIAS